MLYLSVFLISTALKICSWGVFSFSSVGCTKGWTAAKTKPCWYNSCSWAGRSCKEESLIADDPGNSAGNKKKLVNNPTPDYHVFLKSCLFSVKQASHWSIKLTQKLTFPEAHFVFQILSSLSWQRTCITQETGAIKEEVRHIKMPKDILSFSTCHTNAS